MDIVKAEEFVITQLSTGLSPTLYYHNLHHTRDVVEAADRIARAEGITDPESLGLLKTAALYHDIGFLVTYDGHESVGCDYVRQILPSFGYSSAQIEIIMGLILATRVPQSPQTRLEQILCDADLDYLGRDDFSLTAHLLYEELKARDRVTDEAAWNRIQVIFLESHRYWTSTAIATRQSVKQQHSRTLRALI